MRDYEYYEIRVIIKNINNEDNYFGIGKILYDFHKASTKLTQIKAQYPKTTFKLFGYFSEEIEL